MASELITIERPDVAAIKAEYSPLVARANDFAVATVEDHEAGQVYLGQLRAAEKAICDKLDPIVKAAHSAHKMLTTLKNEAIAPLTLARGVIGRKLDAYEAEQRRIAEEKQRAAEAEARRLAEEKALQDAIMAEEAAQAAAEAGDDEAAEQMQAEAAAILDEPVLAPVVHIAPEVAKVNGVSSRQNWKAEVVDEMALIRHVAAHPEWAHLLSPNMVALNGLARSQRDALRIPGVRAVAETVRSVRTA